MDTLDGATVVLIQLELENKDYWVKASVQKETKTQLTVLNRKYNKNTGRLVAAGRYHTSNAACICVYDPSKDQIAEYNARVRLLNTRSQVRLLLTTLADKAGKGELDSSLDELHLELTGWNWKIINN